MPRRRGNVADAASTGGRDAALEDLTQGRGVVGARGSRRAGGRRRFLQDCRERPGVRKDPGVDDARSKGDGRCEQPWGVRGDSRPRRKTITAPEGSERFRRPRRPRPRSESAAAPQTPAKAPGSGDRAEGRDDSETRPLPVAVFPLATAPRRPGDACASGGRLTGEEAGFWETRPWYHGQ